MCRIGRRRVIGAGSGAGIVALGGARFAAAAPPETTGSLAFVAVSVSQNLLAYGNAFMARVVVRGPAGTVHITYAWPGGETTHTMVFDYTSGDESHYETTYTVTGDLPLGRYSVSHLYAEGADGAVLDLAISPDDSQVRASSVDVTIDGNPASAGPGGSPSIMMPPPLPLPPLPPLPMPAAPPAPNPIRFVMAALASPTVVPGGSFSVTAQIDGVAGMIVGQPVVTFSDGAHELFAFFTRFVDGTYRATVRVSRYKPEGTYALIRLYTYNAAGNVLDLRQPDIARFGSDVTIRR